jgi:fatty-acyl-CoA synthase
LSNDTFQSLLTRNAEKYEDKDAFVSHSEDVKHTHKEIKSITDGFGIGLISPGRLYMGERFLTCVPDGQHHLYAYLASGRDGVLFYPNPHNIPMSDFLIRIKDAKAKGLLMPETIPNRDFIEDLDNAMPEYRSLMHGEQFKFPRVPHLRTLFHTGGNMWPGMVSWGSICLRNPAKTPLVPKLPEVPANQPILALPQERTTGEYTLSVHTQESLIRTGVALAEALGIQESDRVEMTVPYHLGVVYPLVLGVLNKAAVLVQPYYKFRTQFVIDSIVKDKSSVLVIRGSDISSLLEQPLEKFDVSSLRTVVVVGGLTPEVEGQIKSKLKAKEVYGLDVVADMPGQFVGLVRKDGKAVPFPYSQAKIVDAQGATVKVGTSGTLKTKGPHVSTSYGGPATWVDKEGWLDTKIQAKMQDDGSFTL